MLTFTSAEKPYVDTLDARPGEPARRDARLRDGRQAALAPARRAGAGRDPRHVRLQGRQVGRADHARRRRASPATGSSAATTPTPGWGARMASERGLRRALRADGARAALGACDGVLRAARHRARALRAAAERARRPAAARQGRSTSYTAVAWIAALVLVVVLGDRRRLRETMRELDEFDSDDMLWLRRDPAAAGPVQRRPEGECGADGVVRGALRGVGFVPVARRARPRVPVRRARSCSTTGSCTISVVLLVGHLYLALIYPADAPFAARDDRRARSDATGPSGTTPSGCASNGQ